MQKGNNMLHTCSYLLLPTLPWTCKTLLCSNCLRDTRAERDRSQWTTTPNISKPALWSFPTTFETLGLAHLVAHDLYASDSSRCLVAIGFARGQSANHKMRIDTLNLKLHWLLIMYIPCSTVPCHTSASMPLCFYRSCWVKVASIRV